jgi:hypothetical protein
MIKSRQDAYVGDKIELAAFRELECHVARRTALHGTGLGCEIIWNALVEVRGHAALDAVL